MLWWAEQLSRILFAHKRNKKHRRKLVSKFVNINFCNGASTNVPKYSEACYFGLLETLKNFQIMQKLGYWMTLKKQPETIHIVVNLFG